MSRLHVVPEVSIHMARVAIGSVALAEPRKNLRDFPDTSNVQTPGGVLAQGLGMGEQGPPTHRVLMAPGPMNPLGLKAPLGGQ